MTLKVTTLIFDNSHDFIILARNLCFKYDQVIVAGDFNFPDITWSDWACFGSGHLEHFFCYTLDNYFMSQICLLPAR